MPIPFLGEKPMEPTLRGGGGFKTFVLFYICSPQKFIYYIVVPGRNFLSLPLERGSRKSLIKVSKMINNGPLKSMLKHIGMLIPTVSAIPMGSKLGIVAIWLGLKVGSTRLLHVLPKWALSGNFHYYNIIYQ